MFLGDWGATPDEITGPVAGDDLIPDARLVAIRSITITAPPTRVFPWLRQMGFGRAGWYSWDLIDNLGRKSATVIRPEWQNLSSGDTMPGGPIGFTAVVVNPPTTLVLELRGRGRLARRIRFSLAYELRELPAGTRLVTRVRSRIDLPLGRFVERFVLGPGDGFMLRRQLVNVARRAESTD